MALSVVERWQQTADVEVFYDHSQRRITYKKYAWIYSQSVDSGQSTSYTEVPGLE